MVVVGTFHTHFDHGSHPSNGIPCLSVCTHIHMHVVVLPVDVVVFSSRLGWWKALPVSPATSSKVQKVTVTGWGVDLKYHTKKLTPSNNTAIYTNDS